MNECSCLTQQVQPKIQCLWQKHEETCAGAPASDHVLGHNIEQELLCACALHFIRSCSERSIPVVLSAHIGILPAEQAGRTA